MFRLYRKCRNYLNYTIDVYMKDSDVATHRLSKNVMQHNLHKRTSTNSCRNKLGCKCLPSIYQTSTSWAIFCQHVKSSRLFLNYVAMRAHAVANVTFGQSTPQAGRRKVCDFLEQLNAYKSTNAKARGTLVLKSHKHRSHWTAERPCSQEILSCLT